MTDFLHDGTGSWESVSTKHLWYWRSPTEPPMASPGLQILAPSLLNVVLVEECLEPLVPDGEREAVLRGDRDPSEHLQLGTVGVGRGQVDETEAWQVFPLVVVGLFLVSAAVSSTSSLRL